MSKWGQREPGCRCDYNFTCRACLTAAAHRIIRFGALQTTDPDKKANPS